MKNLKLKAMLLGLTGLGIMGHVNAEPVGSIFIMDPSTTHHYVVADSDNVIISDKYRDIINYNIVAPDQIRYTTATDEIGTEPALTVTGFIGNGINNDPALNGEIARHVTLGPYKVYILGGNVSVPNLEGALDGSLVKNEDGPPTLIREKGVVLGYDGVLLSNSGSIFNKEKNAIKPTVDKYTDFNSGSIYLSDNVSKADLDKYSKILADNNSNTKLVVTGKLLDNHNKEINSLSIEDALSMSAKNQYSLSTTVKIDGKDVEKVVFSKLGIDTNGNDKLYHSDYIDKVKIADKTLFIPEGIIAKSIDFGNDIKLVKVNEISKVGGYDYRTIWEETGYEHFDSKEIDGEIILGNKEQNGDAITGNKDLVLILDDYNKLKFVLGPTNNVNADVIVNTGVIDVSNGASATFNKDVLLNRIDYGNWKVSELPRIDAVNGKIVFNGNVGLRQGIMHTANTDLVFNKNLYIDFKDSEADIQNSKVEAANISVSEGGTLLAKNTNFKVGVLSTEDKYSSKANYDFYNKLIDENIYLDEQQKENLKNMPAAQSYISLVDSNVKARSIEITGNGRLELSGSKDNIEYNTDILLVNRSGRIILNGGTLKVNQFLGSGYVSDIDKEAINAPEGTFAPKGEIFVSGGTLDVDNLRALLSGELLTEDNVKDIGVTPEELAAFKKVIIKDQPIISLNEDGKIKTTTNQIFANSAAEGQKESGKLTNTAIEYNDGALIFSDNYKGSYVESAKKALQEYDNNSHTKIVMTGNELTEDNKIKDNISIEAAKDRTENNIITTTPVVVTDDNEKNITKLVINEDKTGVEDTTKYVDGNIQASELQVGKALKEIEVNGKDLTILGGKDGNILKTEDSNQTVAINVKSNLQIGNPDLSKDNITKTNVNADIKVEDGANLLINTANVTPEKSFTTEGNAYLIINNGSTLTLANNKEEAPKVNISGDTTIMVGDKDTHGRLMLKGVALNGARVLIDPNWDSPYYSEVNLQDLANNTLDGKLTVGKNSVLNVDPTQEDIDLTTTHEDANEAVLGVYTPTIVDPDKGSILVDPTLIGTEGENSILAANLPPNTVAMADNTVFYTKASTILDAADKNMGVLNAKTILLPAVSEEEDNYAAQAYISGSLADYAKLGNALNNNQKLYLVKAETPMANGFKEVGFDDVADLINLKGQLAADKQGVELVYDNDKNKSVFNKVKDAFPGEKILLANNIDAALAGLVKDAQDPAKDLTKNPALNFLSDAIINTDRENVLNSMANMADLGGVTKESYNNLNKFTDTVENFSSQRNLWATYTHSNNNSDVDLTGNKASYSAKSNGLVIGGSLAQNDKQNWGMAVFYNKGKVTANSGLQTKNDVRSYGIGFYATNKLAKGELVSQFAVSRNNNDIEQFGTKAKANTSNYSLAVKYQQPMVKANGTLTPYIGLRFAHLGGANFTNSLGFKYNVAASNVVSMPFGVKYAGQVVKGNTTIAPFAELGYTPVLSGKNHKVTVGLNATDSFTNTVLDNTWHAKVGANITKGNNTFGLSYARVQGHQTKDNQFMATAEFKF